MKLDPVKLAHLARRMAEAGGDDEDEDDDSDPEDAAKD